MNKRVLVTGGTGFTGSHLCKRLATGGYAVRAIVRDPEQSNDLRSLGVEVVAGDVRDQASLERAAQGIDTVYHIAALFRPENVSRRDMWEVNAQGTHNILDAAIKAGVKRFVHCSTIGVHGDIKDPPADEQTPYDPSDYYQESKTEGEKIAIEYMREGRIPISIFCPAGIYGPGDLRFLKLFESIQKQRFVMLGSGNTLYHLIYIDDLVDGILLCGTKAEAVGNIYILAGQAPVTLNQLVGAIADVLDVPRPRLRLPVSPIYAAGFLCELICKPLGIHPPLYRRRVAFFQKNRAFSIRKAQQELGFRPKVDLKTGLRKTAEWYQQHGYLANGRRYAVEQG